MVTKLKYYRVQINCIVFTYQSKYAKYSLEITYVTIYRVEYYGELFVINYSLLSFEVVSFIFSSVNMK